MNLSSRVAAVALPILSSVLWVAWLLQRPSVHREVTPAALDLDRVLDERPLDVLILGNSAAKRNIDPRQLGEELGRDVLDIGLPGTLAPTWYVVLRDRVYGRGLRPNLVIVADTPPGMLARQPSSPRMHAKMMELASGMDPMEERRAYGGAGNALSRIATRSSVVRSALVDGLRNTVAGLLFAPRGEGTLLERGRERADAAVKAALGEGGTVAAGLEGAMQPTVRRLRPDELELVQGRMEDSFLVDIAEIVEANGGRLVVVHLPRRDGNLDPGAFEGRAEIVDWLNGRGIPYLDLSREHTDAALFMDNNHMSAEGKAALTATLAETLRSRVLEGDGFTPTVVPGEPVTAERIGAPPAPAAGRLERVDECTYTVAAPPGLGGPALARLRVHTPPVAVLEDGSPLRRTATDEGGCSGTFVPSADPIVVHPSSPEVGPERLQVVLDPAVPVVVPVEIGPLTRIGAGTPRPGGVAGHWVYPGTAVRFAFPDGWSYEDGVVLTSALVVASGAGAGEAALTVDGAPVPLRTDGRVLRAGPVPADAAGPWALEWSSPADGPWLLVRDVEVGPRGAPIHVVGSPSTSAVTASFLPSPVTPGTVTFAGDPPALERGQVIVARGGQARVPVDGPVLTLRAANRVAGKKACSPVNVELDGELLDAHAGKAGVQFDASRHWEGAGRARPVLHPERRCTWWPAERGGGSKGAGPLFMAPLRTARWLYPGDVATFTRPDLAELHGLGSVLVIEGFRFGKPVPLSVELLAEGAASERITVPLKPGEIAVSHRLTTPLDPRAVGEVSLVLRTTDDDPGFVYVTALYLAEAP